MTILERHTEEVGIISCLMLFLGLIILQLAIFVFDFTEAIKELVFLIMPVFVAVGVGGTIWAYLVVPRLLSRD